MTKGLINTYSILDGGNQYDENRSQNYLVFPPFSRYFTSKNGKIYSWQSKGISDENITLPSTTSNSFDP